MDWPTAGSLLGATGALIVAVAGAVKNWRESKAGVRSAKRDDQAAWDARYQAILDEVQESLVGPLREEVARLRAEVQHLRADLQAERADLREERARYRAALAHIRSWSSWAVLNAAHDAEPVPEPPDRILDDLR